MTVGIGAIHHDGDNPGIVFAADRMVTVGKRTKIEYEDTDSKLETITDTDGLTAIAVGSGSLSLVDDILNRVDQKLVDDPVSTMPELADHFREAFQEMEQDVFNNQVLSSFGIEIEQLHDPDVSFGAHMEESILTEIGNVRNTIRDNVNILIGGVERGEMPEIYTINNGDFTSFTNTGYAVVGSGTQSAKLTFIRNGYDASESDEVEALFSVAEAKFQAEERQGVGRDMDVAKLGPDGVDQLDDIERLREAMVEVQKRQHRARQNVMDEWV